MTEKNDELLSLLEALCRIPAPSGYEGARAEFCKKWLEDRGARGVYIDKAQNAVLPYCDDGGELTVFGAHTDTVFPDTEPFSVVKEGDRWSCPRYR